MGRAQAWRVAVRAAAKPRDQAPAPARGGAPAAPAASRLPHLLALLLLALLACAALAPSAARSVRAAGAAPAAAGTSLCARTDWAAAPAVSPPEHWVQSKVFGDEQTPLPFWLALPPREASFVTQYMASSGMWAPVETLLFLTVLTSPKVRHAAGVVVDVGANLGYFSQLALGLGYEVYAFEPQARAQPYLAATAARNGNGARWHLHACALGGVRGTVAMADTAMWEVPAVARVVPQEAPAVPDAAAAATGARGPNATVPMALLADVLPPGVPIALLKVDTEGWERGVFAGATPALLAQVRNVIVEAKTGEVRLWLAKLLGEAGFHCAQYQEEYIEAQGVGKWVETRLSRDALRSGVAVRLVRPCSAVDPEDFFFTKEDLPWQCDTVGC